MKAIYFITIALALAACSPPPPQAPTSQFQLINIGSGGILMFNPANGDTWLLDITTNRQGWVPVAALPR
jgi:hypothetical protein